MSQTVTKTLFLPGAGASASFWKPAADHAKVDGVFMSWPGLGNEPPKSEVNSINDLVAMVVGHMADPVNIVAQSMGGLVALRAALAAPGKLNRLVLAVTSAGVPVDDLGGANWQIDYYRTFPHAGRWIENTHEDLSERMATVIAPTLLLWGDRDPISPPTVGERIRDLLPDARLHVIAGAGHDLAQTHAPLVGNLLERHLAGHSIMDVSQTMD